MKTIRRTTKDGDLQEVQYQKDATVTLDWMNGKNYPPAVTIKKGDELISWNFLKDPCGSFYAEGLGRPWPAHERKMFDKCLDLGKDREKAMDKYYSLIAQTKKPEKEDNDRARPENCRYC